jgi:hypothetical protein
MTLRIALSIVPYGIEDNISQIGTIDIWNLGKNAEGTFDYAVVQLKHDPFLNAWETADGKGLVDYDKSGCVIGVQDHEDEDIKIVRVYGHDRISSDAYDLLYRALVALGYPHP